MQPNSIQDLINSIPDNEKELLSDGYHTFKELYEHRVTLFIALANTHCDLLNELYDKTKTTSPRLFPFWKALKHEDGTMYDGWFIAWFETTPWKCFTYHLPISEWDNLHCPEVGHSPKYDGHTAQDTIRLLKNNFC